MATSEITQSAGPLIFTFEKQESNSTHVNISEVVDVDKLLPLLN